jgi:hypothetical protein
MNGTAKSSQVFSPSNNGLVLDDAVHRAGAGAAAEGAAAATAAAAVVACLCSPSARQRGRGGRSLGVSYLWQRQACSAASLHAGGV